MTGFCVFGGGPLSVCPLFASPVVLLYSLTHSLTLTRAMEKSFTLGQVLSAGAVGLLTGFLISHAAIVGRDLLFSILVPDIAHVSVFLTAFSLFLRFSRSKRLQRPHPRRNRTERTRKRRNQTKSPQRIQSPLLTPPLPPMPQLKPRRSKKTLRNTRTRRTFRTRKARTKRTRSLLISMISEKNTRWCWSSDPI